MLTIFNDGNIILECPHDLLTHNRKERSKVPSQLLPDDGDMVRVMSDRRSNRILSLESLRASWVSCD